MGGGGGGSYTGWKSERLVELVRKEADKSAGQFEVKLAGILAGLLAVYNGRDITLVTQRLGEAKDALESDLETSFDQLFGGSVAKHTYVDGLSDIDTLLVIKESKFQNMKPRAILKRLTEVLREGLPDAKEISHGRMAVTISYADGMEIQLLPALRVEGGLKVPSATKPGWSRIDPDGFRNALTKVNSDCGGKLVPTIKLAKAIVASMPEQYRLSGYHVESIAIAAFKGYAGPKATESMLPFFFDQARRLVLTPIRDSTGQSVHVDAYLGVENSDLRQNVSHLLGAFAKRMRNASAGQSEAQWKALFAYE